MHYGRPVPAQQQQQHHHHQHQQQHSQPPQRRRKALEIVSGRGAERVRFAPFTGRESHAAKAAPGWCGDVGGILGAGSAVGPEPGHPRCGCDNRRQQAGPGHVSGGCRCWLSEAAAPPEAAPSAGAETAAAGEAAAQSGGESHSITNRLGFNSRLKSSVETMKTLQQALSTVTSSTHPSLTADTLSLLRQYHTALKVSIRLAFDEALVIRKMDRQAQGAKLQSSPLPSMSPSSSPVSADQPAQACAPLALGAQATVESPRMATHGSGPAAAAAVTARPSCQPAASCERGAPPPPPSPAAAPVSLPSAAAAASPAGAASDVVCAASDAGAAAGAAVAGAAALPVLKIPVPGAPLAPQPAAAATFTAAAAAPLGPVPTHHYPQYAPFHPEVLVHPPLEYTQPSGFRFSLTPAERKRQSASPPVAAPAKQTRLK